MRFLPIFLLAAALAGCTKSHGPLTTYFVGAARFVSGNRTSNSLPGAADTLAARLYVDATDKGTQGLKRLYITVDYSPRLQPFVYPTPITNFRPSSVTPPSEQLVYMDSTFTGAPSELLFTTVFGVRTSTGTEHWTFTATDNAGNSSARSFILAQRRADSATVYNDYTLRLPVPATSKTARRFLDLKTGLALPGFTVASNPAQQARTDIVVLPDGLTLASPDGLAAMYFGSNKWPVSNRSSTRFVLTSLTPTAFTGITDAVGLQQQFVGTGTARITGLLVDQVYAFYVTDNEKKARSYGLLRIIALPAGTTAGLQIEIRMQKPAL